MFPNLESPLPPPFQTANLTPREVCGASDRKDEINRRLRFITACQLVRRYVASRRSIRNKARQESVSAAELLNDVPSNPGIAKRRRVAGPFRSACGQCHREKPLARHGRVYRRRRLGPGLVRSAKGKSESNITIVAGQRSRGRTIQRAYAARGHGNAQRMREAGCSDKEHVARG